MKAKILSLLRNKYPGYVSGEEISSLLGVSRTAIWKHIKKLREGGYQIESHSKIGYRLIQTPDRLYEYELANLLQTKLIGNKIVYKTVVDSTNELAKELAAEGAEEGTVVIAEEQTSGKGRMGRKWYSPSGQGLWFTIIFRPNISPADAAKLTLVGAVAVAKTIREFTGLPAGIKWPNDILIENRKVAGILTEMNAEIDKVNYIVMGIGINVQLDTETMPADLAGIATGLAQEGRDRVARVGFLAALLNNFDPLYGQFVDGDFATVLSAWKEMSVTLNRWVKVSSINMSEEGLAFDIDEEGALLLMKKDGVMKKVYSGDVSLR